MADKNDVTNDEADKDTSETKAAEAPKKMAKTSKAAKKKSKKAKRARRTNTSADDSESARTRTARPYPASSFTDALPLGEAIMKSAAGDKVRRLTLLQQMDKSPTSSATKMMITNSGKYGVTKGSYAAEYLELTEKGRIVVDTSKSARERKQAAFDLAIEGVAPFKLLYDQYKEKRQIGRAHV